MDYRDIYGDLDCFTSFKNKLERVVKTHYLGLACKLRGKGKLLTIWFKLVGHVINYGKVAVVSYGKYLLFANIIEGFQTQTGWAKLKFRLIGDREDREFVPIKGSYVIFQWGDGQPFSLEEFRHDILEMWYLKGLIGWDQDKSKKRIMVEFEKSPGAGGWKEVFNSYEDQSGFIGIISSRKITNQIKKWEYFVPRNTDERQQLQKDLDKVESKFFFDLGMRHNPFAKEERQNNPEVTSGQSYFDAWEVKHQEGLVEGILDFQEKPWGEGKYTFQFGSLPTLLIENKTTQLLTQQTIPNQPFSNNLASQTNNLPQKDNSSQQQIIKRLERELEEVKRKVGFDW